jgi:hypothetical protein
MAGKPLNRLDLRRQREAAEPPDPIEDEPDETAEDGDEEEGTERKTKRKVKAKAKPKAPAKSKAKSSRSPKVAARMRIVWVVLNDAFKPITMHSSRLQRLTIRSAKPPTPRPPK